MTDTLIGFYLEAYHPSFRKRFIQKPKFYFYDVGVTRTLANLISVPLLQSTSYYGEVFEHFIILEIQKLTSYLEVNYRLSYFLTASGVEIDLVVERPGQKTLLIEIKSGQHITELELTNLISISKEQENFEAICLFNGERTLAFQNVTAYPWRIGIIEKVFEGTEISGKIF